MLYGPGGVGKTELCGNLQKIGIRPLIIDLEEGSGFLDVSRLTPLTFDDCREILWARCEKQLTEFDAVVIDSLTKAEELAVEWTLESVPHEKGADIPITSIESYGWGRGYVHVYDTFLRLLGDLDALIRQGVHVICTSHNCTEKVPNPGGDDWLQYQPRLQSPPKQGKIRERVMEWCDHLLYIGFDQAVKNGKAVGSGSRTIYPTQRPTHWAKSRSLANIVDYDQGSPELWRQLFKKDE